MTGLVTTAALLALLAAAPAAPRQLKLEAKPRAAASAAPTDHAAAETRCEVCHTTEGWHVAKFDHAQTGFPLKGSHQRASCKGCHPHDFTSAVPNQCSACHADAHGGELGTRCAGCHDETTWASARFGVDAHRRTAFPLSGRHALVPCQECHMDGRDRRFSRSTVECAGCHARELARASAGSFDHAVLGAQPRCQSCHNAIAFSPASFPEHDRCFEITAGPHAAIRCSGCHSSTPRAAGAAGTCATNNAACSRCHEHNCAEMANEHDEVPGFQCKDRKCYECHRMGVE